MAGSVHKIIAVLTEFEGHGRGRDRDAAVFFHLHEVRARAPCFALCAHLSRHLNSPTKKQEFFSQRGFASIGMRDDRKGATTRDFGRQGGAVCGCVQHGARYRPRWGILEECLARSARHSALFARFGWGAFAGPRQSLGHIIIGIGQIGDVDFDGCGHAAI